MKAWLLSCLVVACGARTGLDVNGVDASSPDAPCDFGIVVADVFGATRLWNGGAPVPAGDYRVTYVDGCMKYSSTQAWTVNAYANGPDTLYVVSGAQAQTRIAPVPGTVGFLEGQGGFASFDACVNANLASDGANELHFAGGVLGVWLADDPYGDNVAGVNGRSPAFRLSCR